jgi:glycogen synthase
VILKPPPGRGPRVALVSRELAPFDDGEVARHVSALAELLADDFEVTILTSARHESAHRRARHKPDGAPPRPRVVFVREPRAWESRHAFSALHAWSARVHAALLGEYGAGGPDLVEFADLFGEGCVAVQGKRTRAALFRTTVCVRVHGSAEIRDVLDGFLPDDDERRFAYELERYALRFCDRLLWPGGDVLGAYQRYYGEAELAPAPRVREPRPSVDPSAAAPGSGPGAGGPRRGAGGARPAGGPLRLLYVGRLGRREGVRELLDALLGLARPDWRLTMVGADTDTAPLGSSMRELLELELAADERVRILDSLPEVELSGLIDAHDALVVPSRWECWPPAALTALERGCPVIATPTGGLAEIVVDGVSGWLARDRSAQALAEAIEPLVERPALARELDPGPGRELGASLTDPEAIRAAYAELCEQGGEDARATAGSTARGELSPVGDDKSPGLAPEGRRTDSERRPPLVSIVIPYFELERYVEQAVATAAAQRHPRTEILIVNDGSLRREDAVLLELEARYGASVVTQPSSGLGAARNLGIDLSRGRYVLPLDADNLVEPDFVGRCVEALEADPEIAYVTSWLRYIDADGRPWKGTEEILMPIGNYSRAVDRLNVAGDAVAVVRREVFDQGLAYSTDVAGFEDWTLYREMRRSGLIGHVIPEPLIGYRLRDDSMMRALTSSREGWARRASDAHIAEQAVQWTAPTP